MGNYNFEDEDKDFGKTVRLDALTEEVRKAENLEETKVFYSEDRKSNGARGSFLKEEIFLNKKLLMLSAIGGLIVFVFIFAVVFLSTSGVLTKKPDVKENSNISDVFVDSQDTYAIVLDTDKNGNVKLYSILSKAEITLKTTAQTKMMGKNGGTISFIEFKPGDIVTVEEESGIAQSIKIPSDIWRKDSVTGAKVDIANKTITVENETYIYGEDTFFVADGIKMFPGDISEADKITVMGKDKGVFTVRLEVGHGFLVFKNLEMVEEAKVFVDDVELVIDKVTLMAEVGCGTKKLTIVGKGFEEHTTMITVDKKTSQTIDLTEVIKEPKGGAVKLKVDQEGYIVKVDGERYLGSLTEIIAPSGSHKIEVEKSGFEKWSTIVDFSEEGQEINVSLKQVVAAEKADKGSLTIYTDPGWGKVYVDGEYVGVAPVMVSITYGEHLVEAELDGYDFYESYVTINGPEKAITATFK